jgi:hypothetical protein
MIKAIIIDDEVHCIDTLSIPADGLLSRGRNNGKMLFAQKRPGGDRQTKTRTCIPGY